MVTKNLNETNFKSALLKNLCIKGLVSNEAIYANKSIEETEFHQALIINASSMGYDFDLADDRPERLVKSFFTAMSKYLGEHKVSKPDEAAALVVEDSNGTFRFAGIVEYNLNEVNPDEPGNWDYVMTFYEDDLHEIEKTKKINRYSSSSTVFKTVFDKVSYDIGEFNFIQENYMYDACLVVVDTMLQVFDHEAREDEVVEIYMDGYFTATISVENGEKVFAIVPDGHMKALIKSDIILEEENDA